MSSDIVYKTVPAKEALRQIKARHYLKMYYHVHLDMQVDKPAEEGSSWRADVFKLLPVTRKQAITLAEEIVEDSDRRVHAGREPLLVTIGRSSSCMFIK